MAELACKRGTYVDRPEHRRHIKETGRAKVVPLQVGNLQMQETYQETILFQKSTVFLDQLWGRLLLHISTSLRHPTVRAANIHSP